MRFCRLPIVLGALAVVAAAPALGVTPGIGLGNGDTKIAITGVVPVICHARVTAPSVPATPGVASLGELREFCNSPRGYRVHADYSPSLVHAKLIVDGVPVPLKPGGTVVVSRSNRAQIDSRDVALDLRGKASSGTLSFRIEPL